MTTTSERSPAAPPVWTLGDRLRKSRESAGLEQEILAVKLGIGRSTISNYERGHGTPNRSVQRSWAWECNVPFEWITGEDQTGGPDTPDPSSENRLYMAARTFSPYSAGTSHSVTESSGVTRIAA